MRKLWTGCLLTANVAGAAPAALTPEPPLALAARAAHVGSARQQLNYLLPLLELRQQRATYLADPSQAGDYWQAAATFASLAGEQDSAAFCWRQLGEATEANLVAGAPATKQPALPAAGPAILARTKGRQLVLFNEEHTQPRGRWLVGSLLPALWQQGFRILALEALEAADTAGVRQRGFAVTASGFYTNEPHFGNLVRRARQLGFRVVAYDAFGPDRDQQAARNLLAMSGLPASGARVVVLAGHGHIDEAPGRHLLAYWLRQLGSLDPFTIDQTQATHASRPDWQHLPPAAYVVPATSLPGSALTCDLYVLNRLAPAAGNTWGAPKMLTTIRVPADSLRPDRAYALQVYDHAEYQRRPDAVPLAVRCLWPGHTMARLALAPGFYTVLLRDAQGQRCWQQPLRQ